MSPRRASIQLGNEVHIDDILNEGVRYMAAPFSDIPSAIEKFRDALQMAVDHGDMIRQAKAYSNIGCCYRKLGMV